MKYFISTLIVFAATTLPGCTANASSSSGPRVDRAICRILGTEGNEKVKGVVRFVQEGTSVRVSWEVEGLPPGLHGFHVHQWGDINCTDGVCTGGHFNPAGVDHGAPDASVRHVGDLGNVNANASGKAAGERLDKMVQLNGAHSVVGRAIIIHAKPDDFGQPTGNAGARMAYGVIGIDGPSGK
jgi:Cu-Zn family superoxide dismutase